jgi:hypothetical protein
MQDHPPHVSVLGIQVGPGPSRVTFFSTSNDTVGNLLDNVMLVRVEPTVIPEPSTVLLLVTGLVGVGAARRWRRYRKV